MPLTALSPIKLPEQFSLPLFLHDALDDDAFAEGPVIELAEYLNYQANTLFAVYARNDDFADRGIFSGDLLIADRQAKPQNDNLLIVCRDQEILCRCFDLRHNRLYVPNDPVEPIACHKESNLRVLGVVIHSIHDLR